MQLDQPRTHLVEGLLCVLAALVATIAIVIIFGETSRLYKLTAGAALAFPLVVYAFGNYRLFFLVGVILSVPLGLSINFMRLIHIGGAASYSIDLYDFFLLPLILFLIRDVVAGYREKILIPRICWWWVGLILLGVIDVILGPFRHLPAYEVVRTMKHLLLFIVIVNECRRIRHFEFVLLALALGLLLQVSVGYLEFIFKADLGLQALGETAAEAIEGTNLGAYGVDVGVYRVGGLMGHPNLFGAYLAILLPIFIALLFTRYNWLVKVGILFVIAAGSIALYLTLSRSGWISFGAAFLMLLLIMTINRFQRPRHLALKGFLVMFTLVIALAASGPILKRLTQSHEGALDFRFEWMQVAMRMVLDKPALGFGLNTSVYYLAPYTSYGSAAAMNERFGYNWPPVHNTYLLIWSEQGTIGLLLFLGFHVHLFKIAYRNMRYYVDERMHSINIGASCGMFALVIDSMASFFIRVPPSGRMFWVVVALIVGIYYWNQANFQFRQAARETTRQAEAALESQPPR